MDTLTLSDTSKDKLRTLAACRNGIDVCGSRRLRSDEAEDESKDDGKDGEAGANVVLQGENDH